MGGDGNATDFKARVIYDERETDIGEVSEWLSESGFEWKAKSVPTGPSALLRLCSYRMRVKNVVGSVSV